MGSKAPKAPKPDPAIARGAQESAALGREQLDFAKEQGEEQAKLGQEYLSFAKEQFTVSKDRQRDIDALTTEISTYFMDIAKGDRERYDTVFKPLEDEFVKTAQEYDSPERRAEAAAKAGADVQSAAARERGAMDRASASVGISPDSGRYAGIDRAYGLGTAAMSVDQQNKARDAVENKGLELKGQAINLGQGVKASGAAAAGAAAQPALAANEQWRASQAIPAAGYSGAQSGEAGQAATTGAGYGGASSGAAGQAATTGTGYQGAQAGAAGQAATTGAGYGGAQVGLSNQATTLGNLHRSNIGIWNTESEIAAQNAAGIGKFAGTAAGVALPLMLSSKDAKTNRKKVAKGEALEQVEGLGIEEYNYKPGVADGGEQRHVGPMAENFAEETGKGDGTTISVQDAIGTALGAIKDLSSKVDRIAEMVGLGANPAAANA